MEGDYGYKQVKELDSNLDVPDSVAILLTTWQSSQMYYLYRILFKISVFK